MARAIWTGSISFGLVNVPVKVYSAVHHQSIQFHQLEESSGARVRNKRVSEKTGKEVPYEKIVKGYEFGKGKYVTVTQDELEDFKPEATKTIDIEDFVDLNDIDPIFYERTYYLAPKGNDGGATKAYALLLKVMTDTERVGIGRVVLRTKQYLAAVRPLEKGVLALSTMLFADEIVPPSQIDTLPDRLPAVNDKELKMAEQLVDSLTTDWKPEKYKDTYREELLDLIEQKAEGKEIVVEEAAEDKQAKVVDLMAALEASLEAAKKGTKAPARSGSRSTAKKRSSTKKAAPRKASAQKRKSA
jgi:DNA end-binding protein Ku